MTTAMTAAAFAGDIQTDTFKTVGGKDVVITAIKHASLRIQYDGFEIQVDPVAKYAPETDYSKFPKADVILVMKDGNIIESGSHDALLAKGGFYKTLYFSQFAGVTEDK